jgi:hypothetical protein
VGLCYFQPHPSENGILGLDWKFVSGMYLKVKRSQGIKQVSAESNRGLCAGDFENSLQNSLICAGANIRRVISSRFQEITCFNKAGSLYWAIIFTIRALQAAS